MRPLQLKDKPNVGNNLIEASAGTGKTYSISNLFLHFVLEGKPIQSILVVTFTEAATKELKERIRDNLLKARKVLMGLEEDETLEAICVQYQEAKSHLETALFNFDQAAVFTIHGFCQRMLKEYAFETSMMFDVELLQEEKEILEEVINDFWRQEVYPLNESQLSYLSLKRDELLHLGRQLMQNPELEFSQLISEEEWQATLLQHEEIKKVCWEVLNLIEEEKATIKNRLYQGALPKNIYKAQQFENKFEDLRHCLKTGLFNSDILEYFGTKIEEKCKKGELPPQHDCFERCKLLLKLDWPDMKRGFSLYLKSKLKRALPDRLTEIKKRYEVMVFSDLISNLHFGLKNEGRDGALHQKIREKFGVVLVDEFQDTDPQQFEIFNTLFGKSEEHSLYMIGDPKQSIYAFRGADVLAYLNAKHQSTQYTLDTNYRSEKGMVDAVNYFFSQKDPRDAFGHPPTEGEEGIVFEPVASGAKRRRLVMRQPEALQLRWFEDPNSNKGFSKSNIKREFTQKVCSEICEMLRLSDQGEIYFETENQPKKLNPSDIAVLVNTHREAIELKQELINLGIPSVISKSGNIFDTSEARDVLRLLMAIKEPSHEYIMPLWLSHFFDDDIHEIYHEMDQRSLAFLKKLYEYQSSWPQVGVLRTLQSFMREYEVEKRLLSRPGGERALSNLMQCREILHEVEMEHGWGLNQLIRFLNEKSHSERKEDERYLQRLETDSDAVQIMTVFKSKGLEFPIVFCPYLWYRSFCESDHQDFSFYKKDKGGVVRQLCMDASDPLNEEYRRQWRRERLAEDLRLLYVALTRSINKCYLYWGHVIKNPNALSFLASDLKSEELLSRDKHDYGFDALKEKNFWECQLAAHSDIGFETFYKSTPQALEYEHDGQVELKPPLVSPVIQQDWMIGSFTSLSKSSYTSTFKSDEVRLQSDDDEHDGIVENQEMMSGFLSFPRGAVAGTALHEMIEQIDFQNPNRWKGVVEKVLMKYRFVEREDDVQNTVMVKDCLEMLKQLGETNLLYTEEKALFLKDIDPRSRMDEMEFFYPCREIELAKLKKIFKKYYAEDEVKAEYFNDLESLNYKMKSGYLTGFIDSIVEHEGQYFLIDWKSNHLGQSKEDYSYQSLKSQIIHSKYYLQFHIYSLALHLLLKQKLKSAYHYEQHFGGVLYVFLRGIGLGKGSGVFYEKMPLGLIEDMSELMIGELS